MKKVLIGSLLLSTLSFANNSRYLEFKVGTDLKSNYSSSNYLLTSKTIGNTSFDVALEFMNEINDQLDIGLGVAYQKHDKRDDGNLFYRQIEGLKFYYSYSGYENSSLPIYLSLKYKFKSENKIVPYLRLDLGYSINFEKKGEVYKSDLEGTIYLDREFKSKNGGYYAAGLGLEAGNLTIEILYSESKSKFYSERTREGWSGNYKKVGVSLGYKFNL